MFLQVKFLLGLAHISRRQIQVVNSEFGRISVFHGAGHEQNVRREPLIIAHGHNHYTVSKSSLLCLPYLHIHMYFILNKCTFEVKKIVRSLEVDANFY